MASISNVNYGASGLINNKELINGYNSSAGARNAHGVNALSSLNGKGESSGALASYKVMVEVNYKTLTSVNSATGQQISFEAMYVKYSASIEEEGKVEASAPFAELMEYISPENTAKRITGFALSAFSGGDEEARQKYSDYIMPAINKGFKNALAILGSLPKDVMDTVNATYQRVQELMSEFVNSGDKPVFEFSALDVMA